MAKTKEKIETVHKELVSVEDTRREDLVKFLKAKTPTLFDRHPVITGNIEQFAEEIIKIFE